MTERLLLSTPQIANPIQNPFNSTASISANDAHPAESVEEEPYTIKCICDYSDDDGNTIYCETCDTWQHIECFYPGRVDDASREEFDHSCADCKPRPLDRRHATERQRHQRQNKATNDSGEKKTKRPPSKSHKKKTKPSELQVNGFIHDNDGLKHGSPQDHHPHTKAKGHRSSKSINSVAKRSPPYNSRPHNHGHPPSPAHTPPDLPNTVQVHGYSDTFRTLYDDDPSINTETNTYHSLAVSNTMSSWLHDPIKLRNDTEVDNRDEVINKITVGLDELKWPNLRVENKEVVINDIPYHWRYLMTPKPLSQSSVVGELNGLVGFQRDYVSDPDNRYQDMSHPRPFVFFHPRLPIFIDTRRQGSQCRYVRRSCRANTTLEINIIADSAEYHFWLISEGTIAANEQITLPWDFRFASYVQSRYDRLWNLEEDDVARAEGADLSDEEYNSISDGIYQALSDHGGCACELGTNCRFVRFHRNYHGRLQALTNGAKPKKGRKPKNHASPTSTGHATNSRAASEGQLDTVEAEDDNASVAGSVRSKPQSRDLTPLIGVRDGMPTETSDREKRKLAMEEQLFQKQAEQGQPPRKKKRASDGSNMSISNGTPQPTPKPRQKSLAQRGSGAQTVGLNGNGPRGRQYVDASTTSRRTSASPYSAVSPTSLLPPQNKVSNRDSMPQQSRQTSVAPVREYVDSSAQTDYVENAWYNRRSETSQQKKNIISLSQRLLKNRQILRGKQEARRREEAANVMNGIEDHGSVGESSAMSAMDLDAPHALENESVGCPGSPLDVRGRAASVVSTTSMDATANGIDTHMLDAPTAVVANAIKPPPPPWPASSATPMSLDPGSVTNLTSMKLQMPPATNFSMPFPPGTPSGSITPASAVATAQSPFASTFPTTFGPTVVNGIPQQSPVKTTKKLSLREYNAQKQAKKTDTANATKPAAGGSPTSTPVILKTPLSTLDEAKAPGVLEGLAIVESPMVEKSVDPMNAAVDNTAPLTNGLPPEPPNGTL